MKRITMKSTLMFLMICLTTSLYAQTSSVNELIKHGKDVAYQAYNAYNKDLFLQAKSIFESAMKLDANNPLPLYYVTYVDYKLLEMSLSNPGDSSFQKIYDTAVKNAERLGKTKGIESEGKVLLAAIYMMKIASDQMSAVSLMPQMFSLLDDAEELNHFNPRTYIIRGAMKFNTPQMFGGSFEEAETNFQKAVKLFESNVQSDSLKPSWGYLESLAWLGRTYEQLKNNDAAKFIYQKTLSIEPEFGWVKYQLLPNLEKKMTK